MSLIISFWFSSSTTGTSALSKVKNNHPTLPVWTLWGSPAFCKWPHTLLRVLSSCSFAYTVTTVPLGWCYLLFSGDFLAFPLCFDNVWGIVLLPLQENPLDVNKPGTHDWWNHCCVRKWAESVWELIGLQALWWVQKARVRPVEVCETEGIMRLSDMRCQHEVDQMCCKKKRKEG